MRRVDSLPRGVQRCAVLPHKGEDKLGFVDTASTLIGVDRPVFVSGTAVVEMARLFDFPTPQEHEEVLRRGVEAQERAERAEAELAEVRKQLGAIDVLESAGFTARKKPGRPKKEQD